MIFILAIAAGLVIAGLLARRGRGRRLTLPAPEQGRWWDQPAATVREPYEQGGGR